MSVPLKCWQLTYTLNGEEDQAVVFAPDALGGVAQFSKRFDTPVTLTNIHLVEGKVYLP